MYSLWIKRLKLQDDKTFVAALETVRLDDVTAHHANCLIALFAFRLTRIVPFIKYSNLGHEAGHSLGFFQWFHESQLMWDMTRHFYRWATD
jgi:hypothetical protein